MWRHWEESSSGGRLACRVVRSVGNALYLAAQGGIASLDLALQREPISARFPTQRGTVGKQRTPKITSEKQEWQRCRYRILWLSVSYRRKSDRFAAIKLLETQSFVEFVSGFAITLQDNSPRWRWKFSQIPCHTQFADLRRRGGDALSTTSFS
jgi:hypothetical protein